MNILLLGATGFVGRHVLTLLRERGDNVSTPTHQQLNLLNLNPNQAYMMLENQDVVINCIGLMSRHAMVLEQIHHHAPRQLVQWAISAGVKKWIQLSALEANAQHNVPFLGSKGRGDEAIIHSGINCFIARPSIIYGRGGASCELFIKLVRFPIIALPKGGDFLLQPVHIQDVAQGLIALIHHTLPPRIIAFTGRQALSLANYLRTIKQGLYQRDNLRIMTIPNSLIQPFLPLCSYLSNGMISADSLQLLSDGSCADYGMFAQLLGRVPRKLEAFFDEN